MAITASKENDTKYTPEEVRQMISQIYSEFAELPTAHHTTNNLRRIIHTEIENRLIKPLKIFKN